MFDNTWPFVIEKSPRPGRSETTIKNKAYKELDISYWQLIFCNLFTEELDKPIMFYIERILEELVIDVFALPESLKDVRQRQLTDVFVFLLEFSTIIGISLSELINLRYYIKIGSNKIPSCPHCLLPNCLCGLIENDYRDVLIRNIYNTDVSQIENKIEEKTTKYILNWLRELRELYTKYQNEIVEKLWSNLEQRKKNKGKKQRSANNVQEVFISSELLNEIKKAFLGILGEHLRKFINKSRNQNLSIMRLLKDFHSVYGRRNISLTTDELYKNLISDLKKFIDSLKKIKQINPNFDFSLGFWIMDGLLGYPLDPNRPILVNRNKILEVGRQITNIKNTLNRLIKILEGTNNLNNYYNNEEKEILNNFKTMINSLSTIFAWYFALLIREFSQEIISKIELRDKPKARMIKDIFNEIDNKIDRIAEAFVTKLLEKYNIKADEPSSLLYRVVDSIGEL
ncbi:MAG: hypothetical protein ACP6IP_01920 [Candidatus Njordarchaeia archaeon]